MKAIKLTVTGSEACVTEKPVLTSGMVGLPVEFTFDEAWEGLNKTAVFKAGSRKYPVPCLQNAAIVPWEVLEKPFMTLSVGVFGADEAGEEKIPTIWAAVDTIQPGTQLPDTVPRAPTPQVYDQILAAANEAVHVADSVRRDADNGVFKGDQGEPGISDLSAYVKDTDYATASKGGVVRAEGPGACSKGIYISSEGLLALRLAKNTEIAGKTNIYFPITPANLDYAVKLALTNTTVTWSEEEKTAARALLGIN